MSRLGILLLPLLLACPKRTPDISEQIDALLRRSDAAYEARGEGGFDPVLSPLTEAYGLDVRHPGVAWRFARLQIAQGLASTEPVAARALFAEARASADRCLRDELPYTTRRQSQGLPAALAIVEPDRRPCVAFLALAWVRWTVAIGPTAAALDLETIDALLSAASRYEDRELRDVVTWAQGLSLATRPSYTGRDLVRARALLDEVIEAERNEIVRQVDRNRFVLVLLSADEAAADRERILSLRARTPEDRQALAELQAE